jgi:hypothetical protein
VDIRTSPQGRDYTCIPSNKQRILADAVILYSPTSQFVSHCLLEADEF